MGFPVVALSGPFTTPEPQFPHLEMGSNNILGHLTVLLWGSVNMTHWRCSGKTQHIFTLGRQGACGSHRGPWSHAVTGTGKRLN